MLKSFQAWSIQTNAKESRMGRNYFLKVVGSADWPLEDHWVASNPELLTEVGTTRNPESIKRDDYLVYYSAGTQKIFAIVRAKGAGSSTPMGGGPGEERWPYRIQVQALLVIPQLALAPSWKVLELPSGKVQQKPYVSISASKYAVAHSAIVERTNPTSLAS
jgi:hypothetical protein